MDKYENWWCCDNTITPLHQGQIGLLHLATPEVFVLVRSAGRLFTTFNDFRDSVAELHFLHPEDRKTANTTELLRQAWNFLALQERADEIATAQFLAEESEYPDI